MADIIDYMSRKIKDADYIELRSHVMSASLYP